jgi:hypothetical protein
MSPLRYVVLFHEGFGEPHYDVMFESSAEASLITFRAPTWPPKSGDRWTRLGEHRRMYLDYQGPVSKDRGTVRRITSGTHTDLGDRDGVFGCTLETSVELDLIKDSPEEWLLILSS